MAASYRMKEWCGMLSERQKELLEILSSGNADKLQDVLEDMHAVDAAACLEEADDDGLMLFRENVSEEFLAEVLEQADEELQIRICGMLDYPAIIRLFTFMPKDDIVDILGILPIGTRKSLLNLMKANDSRELQVLLGYEADTAGGIMTTEYIALSEELSMEQALLKIKEIAPRTEVIETIFVLNRQRQLIGIVDLRDILASPNEEKLRSIMDDNVICVYPEEDQEEVSRLVSKYDLSVVPVINRRQAMLGIITVDDIIDVMLEEQTEDILRMGGVSREETIGGPVLLSIRRRLPWLILNLFTALLAAFAISTFEGVIAKVTALASTMTIISGMGGNAGTQTLSLAIRGIALGELDIKGSSRIVLREILLGFLDGAAVGLISALIMYPRYHNLYLGLIILIAMIGNLVIAGFFGILIPLILKRVGADPALSSTIFLTTATDVFGFLIYLGLAKMFLPLLI